MAYVMTTICKNNSALQTQGHDKFEIGLNYPTTALSTNKKRLFNGFWSFFDLG